MTITVTSTLASAEGLRYTHLISYPRTIDWARPGTGVWAYAEAVECDQCGAPIVNLDDHAGDCSDFGETGSLDLGADGPTSSTFYPCEIEDDVVAARALADLSLCVVTLNVDDDPETGIALTGGGMDMTWELVEGYMRLGHYPPVLLCNLPRFSGMTATRTNMHIVAGCRKTLEVLIRRSQETIHTLDRTEQYLLNGE